MPLAASSDPREPTQIGRVRHILGATITAELYADVAGTTPIYRGRVYQIGQIGSLVRIPQGAVDLVGSITMLGISELVPPAVPAWIPQQGDRWIQFQVLGELDASGGFRRGVSTYPSIDDPVHFAVHDQIARIFPRAGAGRVRLGTLSASRAEPVYLDLGKLVMRHSAIVGSTGSGKSSTAARIIQSILEAGFGRANIVIVDPHGEYSAALAANAAVLSVAPQAADPLFVPYWALPLEDLLLVYARGAEKNPVIRSRLQELVLDLKQARFRRDSWDHRPDS